MIRKVFEDDLISGMQRELRKQASGERPDLVKAAECLHAAIEILEESNLQSRADEILSILTKIAEPEPLQHLVHKVKSGDKAAAARLMEKFVDAGYSPDEIRKKLGPFYLEEHEFRQHLGVKHPEEYLEFKQAAHKKPGRPDRRPVSKLKSPSVEEEVKNYEHYGVPIKPSMADDNLADTNLVDAELADLLNAESFDFNADDDDLLNLEIKDDSLEVFDKMVPMEDFEDEKNSIK